MARPRGGHARGRGGPRPGGARRVPGRPETERAPSADYLQHLVEIGRDPTRWEALDPDALLLIAFQQALYYGANHDADAGASLGALYGYLVGRVTVEERLELLERVGEAVQGGATSVLAMLPFLQRESEPHVAQMAAVSFASLMPLTDDDPMTGPRTLRTLFNHTEDEAVRIGLLAGLLAMGDRRVAPLLPSAWASLSPEGQVALTQAPQPFVSALWVEFLVDALVAAPGASLAAAAVVARLKLLPNEGEARVLDLERKFPENAPDERPEIALLGEWTVRDYGALIADRVRQAAAGPERAWDAEELFRAWGIANASG